LSGGVIIVVGGAVVGPVPESVQCHIGVVRDRSLACQCQRGLAPPLERGVNPVAEDQHGLMGEAARQRGDAERDAGSDRAVHILDISTALNYTETCLPKL